MAIDDEARTFFSVGDDDAETFVVVADNSGGNNDNGFGVVDGYAYLGDQPKPKPEDRSLRDICAVAMIILASRQGGGAVPVGGTGGDDVTKLRKKEWHDPVVGGL